jgi:hypothetical protein
MSSDNQHKANFLASLFLSSNISLKEKYGIKDHHIAIIRYLCDSIDRTHAKTKKFETKIYQSQIARFARCSRKTVNIELQHLLRIKIFKIAKKPDGTKKKNTYTLSTLLPACYLRLQKKEVSPLVTKARSVTQGYTSNSSNFTNKEKQSLAFLNHTPVASVENQTTSYKKDTLKVKPLSEDGIRAMEEAMRKAGVRRYSDRNQDCQQPDNTG